MSNTSHDTKELASNCIDSVPLPALREPSTNGAVTQIVLGLSAGNARHTGYPSLSDEPQHNMDVDISVSIHTGVNEARNTEQPSPRGKTRRTKIMVLGVLLGLLLTAFMILVGAFIATSSPQLLVIMEEIMRVVVDVVKVLMQSW